MMSVIDRKYTALKRTVHGAMIGQHNVTLTADMWTSQSEQGYFSLTAHYVTSEFEMKHSSLHMPGTHDHSHLSGAISNSLCEWCIHADKDVTAYGSNVVKAVKEDLDKIHFPCAGHTLNLSVQKAFEVQAVQKAISRLKRVVEHFNKSRPHHEELENKQKMKLIQVILTVQAYCDICLLCILYSNHTHLHTHNFILNLFFKCSYLCCREYCIGGILCMI